MHLMKKDCVIIATSSRSLSRNHNIKQRDTKITKDQSQQQRICALVTE